MNCEKNADTHSCFDTVAQCSEIRFFYFHFYGREKIFSIIIESNLLLGSDYQKDI